jgi:hypothetical protein
LQDESERARFQDEINQRMKEEKEWVVLHGDESAIREFPLIVVRKIEALEIELGGSKEDGEGGDGYRAEMWKIESLEGDSTIVELVDMV